MTVREIADLFADLELRLIQSLKRNLTAHKSQEKAEGGQNGVPESWPAWQAEKLRSLNRFRQQNQKIGRSSPAKSTRRHAPCWSSSLPRRTAASRLFSGSTARRWVPSSTR